MRVPAAREPAPCVVQRMFDAGFTVLCQDRGLVESAGVKTLSWGKERTFLSMGGEGIGRCQEGWSSGRSQSGEDQAWTQTGGQKPLLLVRHLETYSDI